MPSTAYQATQWPPAPEWSADKDAAWRQLKVYLIQAKAAYNDAVAKLAALAPGKGS